jgi:hypothetical protein
LHYLHFAGALPSSDQPVKHKLHLFIALRGLGKTHPNVIGKEQQAEFAAAQNG